MAGMSSAKMTFTVSSNKSAVKAYYASSLIMVIIESHSNYLITV